MKKQTKKNLKIIGIVFGVVALAVILILVFGFKQEAFALYPSLQTNGLTKISEDSHSITYQVSWVDNNPITSYYNNPNLCNSNDGAQSNISYSAFIDNGLSASQFVTLYTEQGQNYPFPITLPTNATSTSQVILTSLQGCANVNGNFTPSVPLTYNAVVTCNLINEGSTGIDWGVRNQYCSGNNCPDIHSGYIYGGVVTCNLNIANLNGNVNGQQVPVYLYNGLSGTATISFLKPGTECVSDVQCSPGLTCQNYQCINPPQSLQVYYEFSNNLCTQISKLPSQALSNDYLTLQLCQSQISNTTQSNTTQNNTNQSNTTQNSTQSNTLVPILVILSAIVVVVSITIISIKLQKKHKRRK